MSRRYVQKFLSYTHRHIDAWIHVHALPDQQIHHVGSRNVRLFLCLRDSANVICHCGGCSQGVQSGVAPVLLLVGLVLSGIEVFISRCCFCFVNRVHC